MTVGFIGTGNMSTAIVRGVLADGSLTAAEIVVFDPDVAKRDALGAELGVQVASSNEELVDLSDVVVLAIKPQVIPLVLPGLAAQIADRRRVVVSIAAGTPIARLETLLATGTTAPDQAVVRVMPNVNAMIGAGMAAVCGNAAATAQDVELVLGIFAAVGDAIELPESQFSTFTAVAGSAPAFAYLFIDSLARGAVKAGMAKDLATRIAAQTVLGSAQMVQQSDLTPWDLIDTVCSPGGTTVAGLLALEDRGFLSTVVHGVTETIARDKELSSGS
ncbi:pyrroline-5-carboxylate reductase [Sanguibacter antarcticus]|uniref:Pyrroline-5-carboxylate reductase n=1 Tax=Sanguibacter antarcticus TaxID=372484 RepID=A0A2A9E3P9_9MICO|nr:pyrroline-5-carboxylate reductase [Sanguibacter antarcticus]PFG33578.1 pyrroline-5-carboxylate reductase [Sanguibacter antarcticus]